MSQRDLTAELRGARIAAPSELRQRVRLIAAADTTPTRRFTWRRALVLALPVAAAIAASIVFTRPSGNHQTATPTVARGAAAGEVHGAKPQHDAAKTFATPSAKTDSGAGAARLAVPSRPGRVQVYGAYLALRLHSA